MSEHIILIDTSYTSFYRFFATLRWMSLAEPDEYKNYKNNNTYDWSQNVIFMDKYKKMYLESIIKLVNKKCFNNSKIIFCMDSARETLWRNEIHTNYKSDRIDLSLKNDFKPVFNYTYETLIPTIIKNYSHIYKIKIDKLEADDIIACITMHLKNTTENIIIVSGDNDFMQLGCKNVKFINYKAKKFIELDKNTALQLLNEKIILGDKSDNIPCIFPDKKELSISKRKELLNDKLLFNSYLDDNPNVKKQYEINQKMIDFNFIPKKYYNKVIKEYNLIN